MLKKVLVCSVVSLFVLCGAVSYSLASDPPETITLGEGGKKPAVFPHKAHIDKGLACGECHHGMADGKQAAYAEGQEIQKCDTCHNAESKELAGKMKGKLKLDTNKGAFHGNCLECHKAQEDKKLAKCSTCHPKKE